VLYNWVWSPHHLRSLFFSAALLFLFLVLQFASDVLFFFFPYLARHCGLATRQGTAKHRQDSLTKAFFFPRAMWRGWVEPMWAGFGLVQTQTIQGGFASNARFFSRLSDEALRSLWVPGTG
jgi:hypothetical protein